MKNRILTLVVAFVAAMSLAAQRTTVETVPADPLGARIYTLPNGLKVYVSVNKEKPRIMAYVAVRTGSRNDPAETTGLAHYLEHIMFKGTQTFGTSDYAAELPYLDDIEKRYEAYRQLTDADARRHAYQEIDSVSQLAAQYNIPNEYDKLMAAIGAEGSNAYTSNDQTCYHEDIPANELEAWLRIQADRFQNMVIRGFHTELEAVYEEFNIGLASDMRKAWVALDAKLFPGHPYGTQTTIGTQEHLKNPSIVNIKNYYQRYYVPNNVAIVLSGDLDPDAAVALVEKYFGTWAKSPTLSRPEYAPVAKLTAAVDTTVTGLEAENIIVGWQLPAAREHAIETAQVVAEMLSNGKAGLFDLHLTQPMKVMGAQAYVNPLTDYGQFLVAGAPLEGQSLEEVRALMLEEVDRLGSGHFEESLLKAAVRNIELSFNRELLENTARAELMKDAFINGVDWADAAAMIKRLHALTKADIQAFAKAYLAQGRVTVFKRQAEDTSVRKIDKPAITAIPSNRHLHSAFLNEMMQHEAAPIAPRFVDYAADLTVAKTKAGQPLLYKQNVDDQLFSLSFAYDFGSKDDLEMAYAAQYLSFIGTKKKSVAEINAAFYDLACDFTVRVHERETRISLRGLAEQMPAALALLDELLQNAKADVESYRQFVALEAKDRADRRQSQRANFSALCDYGLYGDFNPTRHDLTIAALEALEPQKLVGKLAQLRQMPCTTLYFGPLSQAELTALLAKVRPVNAKKLIALPVGTDYAEQPAPATNEIFLAPYAAKNIYMRQYRNTALPFNADELGVIALFNEYFGAGMNTIVFQELRESRALAYNASSRYNALPVPGHPQTYFTHIISQNDKMMDCISAFAEILDTIPASESSFAIAKQSLTKSLESGRTTRENVLSDYYETALRRGLKKSISETIYEQIPALTLADILSFEKARMAGKTYRFVILGDESELDIPALEKVGTIHRLKTDDIFSK